VHGESGYYDDDFQTHFLSVAFDCHHSPISRLHSFLYPQDDTSSIKQVHRTQPILSYIPSILDPKNNHRHPSMTPMSEKNKNKERKHAMAFGLPREKVREFMKSHHIPMHWEVPRSIPTLYP